jgi:hypothetical protein
MANTHRAYANVPDHEKPRLVAAGTEKYCLQALERYKEDHGHDGFVRPITEDDHK